MLPPARDDFLPERQPTGAPMYQTPNPPSRSVLAGPGRAQALSETLYDLVAHNMGHIRNGPFVRRVTSHTWGLNTRRRWKEMSELRPPLWWISTAMVLKPLRNTAGETIRMQTGRGERPTRTHHITYEREREAGKQAVP